MPNIFNGRELTANATDVLIAAGGSATVYLAAPDILTKLQTVLMLGLLWVILYNLCQYIRQKIRDIKAERERLKIRKVDRSDKVINFHVGSERRKYYEFSEKGVRVIYM